MLRLVRTPRFDAWLRDLRDERARTRIAARLLRLRQGLLGDCKSVGGGVSELRLDHGPGYRVYFAQRGDAIVLILCGGDKGSQDRDIVLARALLQDLSQ